MNKIKEKGNDLCLYYQEKIKIKVKALSLCDIKLAPLSILKSIRCILCWPNLAEFDVVRLLGVLVSTTSFLF